LALYYFMKITIETYTHYFLRSFCGTGNWTKCQSRHKTVTYCQNTSPYRPNKDHYKHFTVPVLDQPVSISAGLVPRPVLCPDASAAKRPQEILYILNRVISIIHEKIKVLKNCSVNNMPFF
jgi:hypothetical protein